MTLLDLCNQHSKGSISQFLRLIDLEPTEPHYREMVKDGIPITPFVKSALEHKFRDLSFDHLLDERYPKPKTAKIFTQEGEEPVADLVLDLNEVVQESHSDSPAPVRKPVGKESKPRPEKRGPYKKTVRASAPTGAEIDFLKAADEQILNYTELKDRKRIEATSPYTQSDPVQDIQAMLDNSKPPKPTKTVEEMRDAQYKPYENSLRKDEVAQSKTYVEAGKVVMRDEPSETTKVPYSQEYYDKLDKSIRSPTAEEMQKLFPENKNWFGFAEKMPDPERVIILQSDNEYKIALSGYGAILKYPKIKDQYNGYVSYSDLSAADRWAYLPE